MPNNLLRALVFLASVAAAPAQAQSLTLLCSVQIEWCQLLSTVFQKSSGIRVSMTQRGSGESIAQLAAEAANPKVDIWFGGTGDPHLQAAEQGLSVEYRSPSLAQLHPWAVRQAEQSGYRTVGIYMGALGFGFNTELLAKKKLAPPACWADLVKPAYRGEVQMANPNSSGTAYVAIASLVQLMGEQKAFDYLRALHQNIGQYPRSGTGPIKNVARGETTVSVSFVHDAPGEALAGFPVRAATPCEGTGYEIGSMSIVKGARNFESAKRFYEFALTAAAQELGAAAKQFQVPSNRNAKIHELVPDMKRIKLINYDFAKYGASSERKRLLARWDKEVGNLPR